jgi:hypothetical protein
MKKGTGVFFATETLAAETQHWAKKTPVPFFITRLQRGRRSLGFLFRFAYFSE